MKVKTKILLLASALALSLSCSASAFGYYGPDSNNVRINLITSRGVYLTNLGGSLYQDPWGNRYNIQIVQIHGNQAITSDGSVYAIEVVRG